MSGITLVGDWRKLRHRIDRYSEFGEEEADNIIYECAELVKENMLSYINSEPSPRNQQKTIYNKGFDAPLHETNQFRENSDTICISDIEYDGARGYLVEGNPEEINERSGTDYQEIVDRNNKKWNIFSISYDMSKDEVEKYCRTSLNEWLRR